MRRRSHPVGLLLAASLAASCPWIQGCASVRSTASPVTPQRPTPSSDTSTTAALTFELETGAVVDRDDFLDTPTVLKYGLDRRTELFASISPYRRIDVKGPGDPDGASDLSLGLRNRFWEDGASQTSAAFQLVAKLPTASESEGLSSGELDLFAAGIVTKIVGGTALTGFYELGLLGEEDESGDELDLQHALSLAVGRPLAGALGFFGELAAVISPEAVDTLFTTLGVTYALSPSTVLDVGFVAGIDSDAPDFQLLVGLTTNFGRLFGGR